METDPRQTLKELGNKAETYFSPSIRELRKNFEEIEQQLLGPELSKAKNLRVLTNLMIKSTGQGIIKVLTEMNQECDTLRNVRAGLEKKLNQTLTYQKNELNDSESDAIKYMIDGLKENIEYANALERRYEELRKEVISFIDELGPFPFDGVSKEIYIN